MAATRCLVRSWRRRASRRRSQGPLAAALLVAGGGCSVAALAHDDLTVESTPYAPLIVNQPTKEGATGSGSIAVSYQNTFVDGMRPAVRGPEVPIGTVRVQSLAFDLDYFFADQWSAHVGLPYIVSRYQGPLPHCPTAAPPQCKNAPVLTHPHPESRFLDDGKSHGAWQDWALGVAYHTELDGFLASPSITLYLPSHDYTFFAQAAVGQDLRKLDVAVDVAHQFEFTNLYWRAIVGHDFVQKTLGQDIDYNRLDLELGYFIDEKLTIKAFAAGKKGHGFAGRYDQTTELFYHHDQRAKHNYANVGAGVDYRLGDKYTLSTTLESLVWGEAVFDFKYSWNLRLTRDF